MKPLEVIEQVNRSLRNYNGTCTEGTNGAPCDRCAQAYREIVHTLSNLLRSVTIDPEPTPAHTPDVLDQKVTLLTSGDRVTVRQLLGYHKSQFDLLGYRGANIGEMRAEINRLEGRLATQARTIANYQKQADPELKWLRQEVERLTTLAVDRHKEIMARQDTIARLEEQKDDIAEEAARRIGELATENVNLKYQNAKLVDEEFGYYCDWCGTAFKQETGETPQQAALRHMESCTKHPFYGAQQEIKMLRAANESLRRDRTIRVGIDKAIGVDRTVFIATTH